MVKTGIAKDAPAKDGLGDLLFDAKEKANVEYAFHKPIYHLAELNQLFSPTDNKKLASSLSMALTATESKHVSHICWLELFQEEQRVVQFQKNGIFY